MLLRIAIGTVLALTLCASACKDKSKLEPVSTELPDDPSDAEPGTLPAPHDAEPAAAQDAAPAQRDNYEPINKSDAGPPDIAVPGIVE